MEPISRNRIAVPATLTLLALAIYGKHLGDGYLADDFLFLSWWQDGAGELLRRVTADSSPRMIRPLPALAWGLSELPGGAAIHHTLSLLVHAATAWIVAGLARQGSGSREIGWLAGTLFVSFPLFTEPVIWLSAAPDLWASMLALAAIDAALRRPGRVTAAAVLFALSLLCKESTMMLPLILLCLAPWPQIRRPFLALGAVGLCYLGFRLLIFGGPGGYLGPEGQALALDIDPWRFLRNLTLQFPYRLLVPLKRAGELAPWLGLASAALAVAAGASGRPWRRPRAWLLALAAMVLATLPVAAFFSVSYDHENTRMLYFPIAVLAVALAACVPRPTVLFRAAALAVVGLWSLVAAANGRSWSEASREVRQTLTVMRAAEPRFPTGSTVLIAGHDTWHGAYVWRNGLAFAARLHGLRDDLHWTLGTAAVISRPEDLGRRVFEIGLDAAGHERDWTLCQQELWSARLETLGRAELRGTKEPVDSGPILLRLPSAALAVEILAEPGSRVEGRLRWRHDGIGRFNVSDSRRFEIFPGNRRTIVRLPALPEPPAEIELRLETAAPTARLEVRVVESPSTCR